MYSEAAYQSKLIKKLHVLLPGCFILRNDPAEMQGIPDILILWHEHWAMLECKKSALAHTQPNQEYHIGVLNSMSFASFIYPENEERVLYDLQSAFGIGG